MNRFGFQSLYRSLSRHKLYAALNIGGLAVGIAVFLILSLFVRFETSFEKWLPHHDELYVVQSEWTVPDSPVQGAYPYTMSGLLEQMREDFTGLVGTRIRGGERSGSVIQGGVATMEDVAQVDAVFRAALDAGATELKRPEKVFWGGYSGYFADPDGHVWEIAHNPGWPLSPNGALTLP